MLQTDVRKPHKADRDGVQALLHKAGNFSKAEIDTALELFDDSLAPDDEYISLISQDKPSGEITGFICFGETPLTDRTYDIYWLVVSPPYRRKRHGTLLFDEAQKQIAERNGRMLVIETSSREDYAAARAFYSRHGCKETARVPDYYAKGEDLVLFAKKSGTHPN